MSFENGATAMNSEQRVMTPDERLTRLSDEQRGELARWMRNRAKLWIDFRGEELEAKASALTALSELLENAGERKK